MAYVERKSSTLSMAPITSGAQAQTGVTPAQPEAEGAATSETPVSAWLILLAYGIVAAGSWLGIMIATIWVTPKPMILESIEGISLFAATGNFGFSWLARSQYTPLHFPFEILDQLFSFLLLLLASPTGSLPVTILDFPHSPVFNFQHIFHIL